MDAFLTAKLSTHVRIQSLASEIATQKMLVECLGATNAAGKSAEETLTESAQYELAVATLAAKRRRLAELIDERDTFGVCL